MNVGLGSTEEVSGIKTLDIARLVLLASAILFSWLGLWRGYLPLDFVAVLATIIGGIPVFRETIEALRQKALNMEASMTIGALATLAIGEFVPAAVIIFFALLAEEIESLTMHGGRRAIADLFANAPKMATVRRNGNEVSVPAGSVQVNETVIVRPGEKIPVDGIVVKGTAIVDEAPITGESLPLEKLHGDRVFAGSLNDSGFLELEATRVGVDTTFSRILSLVEKAERSKAPIERLGDRLAASLVYVALILAAVTLVVTRNTISAISVIVVAGACGIAAGTPLALLASITKAAKRGMVVKGGTHVEQLSKIDTVVIDKTGTLTLGEPRVVSVQSLDEHDTRQVVQFAAIAERHSAHPLARAVLSKAAELGTSGAEHTSCEYLPGKGVVCKFEGDEILVGNQALLEAYTVEEPNKVQKLVYNESRNGRTVVLVAHNRHTCGALSVADVVRDEARQAVARMKAMSLHVIMLTGDNETTAQAIGRELGITELYANMLPDQKLEKVRELLASGRKVAMVGDGINDAPALAEANVGIAMGSGTDVALETADVALMTNDLGKIPQLIALSKENRNVIMQNFTGTLLVDGFGVALAVAGLIHPLTAAFIHTVSELAFMLNSARLLRG
jgi:Cd2+/Zn2+-exporting ATPase/Cu+-exporting ATPase